MPDGFGHLLSNIFEEAQLDQPAKFYLITLIGFNIFRVWMILEGETDVVW